jgi:hypothetical protein
MDGGSATIPYRPIDRLIEGLCATIAAQREQIRALETLAVSRGDDAASYRSLATQAIHALRREQQARDRLQARYDRLVAEYREHRVRTLNALERAA